MKVLHCCRGDASALFGEFRIRLRHAFDTAVADSVLRGEHHNTQRGLMKVLTEWVGDEAFNLTHKGKLVHVPGMFQEWPLPLSLFVYAYEDVTYLGLLYRRMARELRSEGLLGLVMDCTRQRCISLGSGPDPPTSVVIGLTDGDSVICLESSRGFSLPSARIEGTEGTAVLKELARKAWERTMLNGCYSERRCLYCNKWWIAETNAGWGYNCSNGASLRLRALAASVASRPQST